MKRELLTPPADVLRSLIAQIETAETSGDSLEATLDEAFYGPREKSCVHCGTWSIFSTACLLSDLDRAIKFASENGWALRSLDFNYSTATARLIKNDDSVESEGLGRNRSGTRAILSALLRGMLKDTSPAHRNRG